jgi:transcription-repair coupling factor (superfamily II helicase)
MKNDKINKQPVAITAESPILVAKRALNEARIALKIARSKVVKGENVAQKSGVRAEALKALAALKAHRKILITEIKTTKQHLKDVRQQVRECGMQKKAAQATMKTLPRATKNLDVERAQVAVLESELAYRKACLG